ncbi:DUF378 domain-containing protein [Candidatus Wolfebacteria bacterium]|nr:DUF378 domain-containing protein [Candidatus Wolfebacteria bacterium]
MKTLHMVTFILLVVGGLNWLIFGLFGMDVVGKVFGGMTTAGAMTAYVLVGLSAIAELLMHKNACKMCKPAGTM